MAAAVAAAQVDANTFRRLYPDDYLRKFVEQGLRPDGRPLAAARPTSIGLCAVSTADARWACAEPCQRRKAVQNPARSVPE